VPHQCLKCGILFNEGSTTILRGCPECRGTRFFYTQKPLTMSERDKLLATSEVTLREAIDQLVKKAKEGEPPTLPTGAHEWVQLKSEPAPDPSPKRLEDFESPPATAAAAPTVTLSEPLVPPIVATDAPRTDVAWLPGNKLLIKKKAEPVARRRRPEPIAYDYAPPTLRTPPAFEPPEPAPLPQTAAPAPSATGPEEPISSPEGTPETIRIANPGEYEIDVKRLLDADPIVIQRDGTYLIHLASLFDAGKGKRE
jgi:predicted  nucleic acid-binding Zn-ribbon protein